MTMRFGDILTHDHLITATQLGDALRWQMLYGVRLGRALIELGYVSENTVAETLSRKLGVPAISRKELLSLPPETVALLPAEIAVECRAIPLGVTGRLLRVAMSDPIDRLFIDRIAQETGTIVQALVAPDLLIALALEQYYGVALSRNELPLRTAAAHVPDLHVADEEEVDYALPADHDNEQQEDPFAAHPQLIGASGVIELDPLAVQLAEARSRDMVADAVMEHLSPRFHATALVMVRDNSLICWRAGDTHRARAACETTPLPLGASPVLRALLKGKSFHGLFTAAPDHTVMIEALQLPANTWLLAQPIILHKKVVAALLLWGDQTATQAAEQELKGVSAKIAMALQMIILRTKILAA